MPLLFNIRHIAEKDLRLEGELSEKELEIEFGDEMSHPAGPLRYDLTVQQIEHEILVRGNLHLPLDCECVRCLKSFKQEVDLKDWTALLPLEGEEKIVIHNDLVDLTPFLREDILLAFPQHPLCKPDCGGLPKKYSGKSKKAESPAPQEDRWAALNKLKL